VVTYNLKVDDELWKRFKDTITQNQRIGQVLVEMIRERVRRFEGRKKSGSLVPQQKAEKKKEAGGAQRDAAGGPVQKGEAEGKPNAEPGEVAEAGGVQKDAGGPPQEEEKGGALG